MASAFISDLGLSKRCFAVTVSRGSGDAANKTLGAKVTGVVHSAEGLSFTLQPAALPMPVPEEAAAGARLVSLGARLSGEVLTVRGLPEGTYRLFIDGTEVGSYDAAALATKVELADHPKTLLYQQAQRVAVLNARRHAESVLPIRELWRWRKIVARVRADLAAHPDDPLLQRRLTAHSRHLEDFDADLAKYQAVGRAIEDEIYQANQPPKLNFRLERATRVGP